jgi:hypothetical protein
LQWTTFSAYFDQFNGPIQLKLLFESNLPSSAHYVHTYLLGCAVIFALKRNEAKRKQNFFCFYAKKVLFFAHFASMRNVEICSEMKMERSENKTKKKQKTAIIFASKRNEVKWKQKNAIIFALTFFASMRKKCFSLVFASEAKQK